MRLTADSKILAISLLVKDFSDMSLKEVLYGRIQIISRWVFFTPFPSEPSKEEKSHWCSVNKSGKIDTERPEWKVEGKKPVYDDKTGESGQSDNC